MLDAQALAAPVPGTLLVLLSRLHRCEDPVFDGEPRVDASEDPLPGESCSLVATRPGLMMTSPRHRGDGARHS